MRGHVVLLFALSWLLLSGCQRSLTACPPPTGTPKYLTSLPPTAFPISASSPSPAPIPVQIGGRTVAVDQVVEGPLCGGNWSGTVYVTCDVQVLEWKEQPSFLENCDLSITPGTVVYVAYHNDAPYYNGCSCHTGEIGQP